MYVQNRFRFIEFARLCAQWQMSAHFNLAMIVTWCALQEEWEGIQVYKIWLMGVGMTGTAAGVSWSENGGWDGLRGWNSVSCPIFSRCFSPMHHRWPYFTFCLRPLCIQRYSRVISHRSHPRRLNIRSISEKHRPGSPLPRIWD